MSISSVESICMKASDFDVFADNSDAVFHYTKADTALEFILPTKRFRLSLLKNANDPREYKFKLLSMTGWSLPEGIQSLYNECHPEIDRILRHECRIMCLCSNDPVKVIDDAGQIQEDPIPSTLGWSKPRMWAQYGGNHHGVCLVFSRNALISQFKNCKPDVEWLRYENVIYTTAGKYNFATLDIQGNSLQRSGVKQYCRQHVEVHWRDLFFTKHKDYRDESEFRIVAHDPLSKLESVDLLESLRGIIVGDMMHDVYFPLFERLAADLKIEARQAYWSNGKPHLIGLVKGSVT